MASAAAAYSTQCSSLTTTGSRCTLKPINGSIYCGRHKDNPLTEMSKVSATTCKGKTAKGAACTKKTTSANGYCYLHDEKSNKNIPEAIKPDYGRCIGITKKSVQCSHSAVDENKYCYLHSKETDKANKEEKKKESFACAGITVTGALCSSYAQEGRRYCFRHDEKTDITNAARAKELCEERGCCKKMVEGKKYCESCLQRRSEKGYNCKNKECKNKVKASDSLCSTCFDKRKRCAGFNGKSCSNLTDSDPSDLCIACIAASKSTPRCTGCSSIVIEGAYCDRCREKLRDEADRARRSSAKAINYDFREDYLNIRFKNLQPNMQNILVEAIRYLELGTSTHSDINPRKLMSMYRRLSVKHHPDKGGDPEVFKLISSYKETIIEFMEN
jgi:hypothetical protein